MAAYVGGPPAPRRRAAGAARRVPRPVGVGMRRARALRRPGRRWRPASVGAAPAAARAGAAAGPGAGAVAARPRLGRAVPRRHARARRAARRVRGRRAMSVRDVVRRTDAGDGYATMSAGTRAGACRPSGQVLEPDEDFFGDAGRRGVPSATPGVTATDGPASRFGSPALVERNERPRLRRRDRRPRRGAGRRRRAAGRHRQRRRRGATLEGPTFHRAAGDALIDDQGMVPAGAVSDAAPRG